MQRPFNYIIDNKKAIPIDDIGMWACWMTTANRTVTKTEVSLVRVWTVFLGIDHQFYEGRPLLFETRIFGGEFEHYTWFWSTWEEAENGHKMVCSEVFGKAWESA